MFNITNFNEHPTRKAYTIFHFFQKERSDYFEELLKQQHIWYEADMDETTTKTTYFFGVRNTDLKKVQQINYLVSAKYRTPTIPNKYLRFFIYLISFILLALAFIGFLKSKS